MPHFESPPQAGRGRFGKRWKMDSPPSEFPRQADEAFHCRHAMPTVVFWVIRRYKFVTGQTSSSAVADFPIITY
jgi:hypothetical protein